MKNALATSVHIIGAGKHALVIADIFLHLPHYRLVSFLGEDEYPNQITEKRVTSNRSFSVQSQGEFLRTYSRERDGYLILGLGGGLLSVREKFINELNSDFFCTAIHPRATIAASVVIDVGTVVMAGAILNPFVRIGKHVTVNTGAIIDHECEIGGNTFIQPGAVLAGNVRVGQSSIIGIGANVKEGVSIGSHCIIGGGAFVNRDVPDHVVYVGVPAKKLRDN